MNADADSSGTSLSLLARLRDSDSDLGWEEFVRRYRPRICGWCRHWGLSDADAEDVTQEVLMQISQQMKTFRYDASGRFRSWLKTVVWRAWAKFLKSRERNLALPNGVDLLHSVHSLEARDDLIQRVEHEAARELMDLAITSVRPKVNPNTWSAFQLMTFENLSGAEVALQLTMSEASVFVARSRVQKMILKEVQRLDGEA